MHRPTYTEVIERLAARHGAEFEAPKGVDHLIRYFGAPRVEVTDTRHGFVRRGRISITTGWRPALMLMHRASDTGSSDLLGPDDRVTALIDGRGRRTPV